MIAMPESEVPILNFVMSYSGGKDSALALYRMLSEKNTPVALLTTINMEQKRSWFHGLQKELLEAVSKSVGIPLITCECLPDDYEKSFEEGLLKAKGLGATACVFGDIDISGHRQWNEARCMNTDMKCILPLWNENREELVVELIELGFKALIKTIQCDMLNESFLGKTLSISLLEQIKLTGSDVCGENGEYHTFVYDGPIFQAQIPIVAKGIIDFNTHKAIDISVSNIAT